MRRVFSMTVRIAAMVLVAACGDTAEDAELRIEARSDSGSVPIVQGEDATRAMPPARDPDRPAGSLGTADDATQMAATLSEYAIDLSPDTIQPGETTINIENRGERAHTIEVRHPTRGRWRTIPIPPGGAVRLSMPLPAGTYEIFSTDEDYQDRGMRSTFVVR